MSRAMDSIYQPIKVVQSTDAHKDIQGDNTMMNSSKLGIQGSSDLKNRRQTRERSNSMLETTGAKGTD